MDPPRPRYRYSSFYKECASYPELPKFRRFGAQWTKKLYDDAEEVLKLEEDLSAAIAVFRRSQGKAALTALDCPRSLAKEDSKLYEQWMDYEQKLRTYTEDLWLSHKLFQMPDQAHYFSDRLKKHVKLFDGGDFGPTNEKGAAAAYQDQAARDYVAWVNIEDSDLLSNLCINNIEWIERVILRRVRRLFYGRRSLQDGQQTTVQLLTIVKAIDALTCIFVPLLLTAAMFSLVATRPLKVRIAMVGVFGLVFSISAKVVSGRTSRGDLFAYSAAFFAVASVFISSTDNNGAQIP